MSQKIRIGNDIDITWSLKDADDQPYIVEGKNVEIELNVGTKRVKIKEFELSSNQIHFVYYGKDQKHTGSYALKYIENPDDPNMVTFDTKDAFYMVDHSWLAVDEGETPEAIQLEVVTIGSTLLEKQGPRGYSAYEIAVQEGFVGTVDEWLASLNGDAAGFGEVDAEVDANIGTPEVEVSTSGPDTEKNIHFKFKNIKGEKGDEPVLTAGTDGTIYSDGQVLTEVIKDAKTQASDDHSRAELDHTQASNDHTQAGSDHSTASGDHVQAGNDHTQAVSDHGVAAADHTQAGLDHNASTEATAKANNVNATIDGTVVTITDKNGVSTSVDIGFDIYKTYASVAAMNADAANVAEGKFVMIATIDQTSTENAQLYVRNENAASSESPFTFLCDLDQAATSAWADWFENYKPTIEADHTRAENDHTLASSDHGTAAADHTQAGNDHTRAEGDHSTAADDHTLAGTDHNTAASDHTLAGTDHQTAASDHTLAGTDHQTAASDHTTASNDHTTAGNDHTTAGNDHTRAESDHTRAEADHASIADKVSQEEMAAALANKANINGTYKTMAVGIADNLEGRSVEEDAFFVRPTGGNAEVANGPAQMLGVKGNSVEYNQLCAMISSTNCTNVAYASIVGNSIVLTTNYYGRADFISSYQNQIISGHKYILRFVCDKTGNTSFNIKIRTTNNDDIFIYEVWDSGFKQEIFTANSTLTFGRIHIQLKTGTAFPKGESISVSNFQIIDLTLAGYPDIATTTPMVAEVEAWLAANVGLFDYYPYNAGTVLNNKMKGLESIGFNLLDPATGKAELPGAYSDLYGNYYGITGTHGTLTFTDRIGNTSTVTPDSDGKFLIETPGTLDVATPGADCAVFLWWDGTKTEYEEYQRDVARLDVTHIWGKLNGTGELVRVWPTGIPGLGTLQDSLGIDNGEVVARRVVGEVDLGTLNWGYNNTAVSYCVFKSDSLTLSKQYGADTIANAICSRYYVGYRENVVLGTNDKAFSISGSTVIVSGSRLAVSDSSYTDPDVFKTSMSGVTLYYELATPEVYTDLVYKDSPYFADGTPVSLPTIIQVNNWGVERTLPQNSSSSVSYAAPTLVMRYGIDAVEQIDTLRVGSIMVDDLKSNIQALLSVVNDKLAETMGGTIGISENATNKVYSFTFTPTPEPEPEPEEEQTE